jgi:hypothetical protein
MAGRGSARVGRLARVLASRLPSSAGARGTIRTRFRTLGVPRPRASLSPLPEVHQRASLRLGQSLALPANPEFLASWSGIAYVGCPLHVDSFDLVLFKESGAKFSDRRSLPACVGGYRRKLERELQVPTRLLRGGYQMFATLRSRCNVH